MLGFGMIARRGALRRAAMAVAAAALALLMLARNRPSELAGRFRYLRSYASRELPVRRLGGSSAAFDRRFFLFLESARRRLPADAAGVALLVPDPSESALYLAAYHFAPIPVELSPERLRAGWIIALYGASRPPGWKVLAEIPGGALMAPGAPLS